MNSLGYKTFTYKKLLSEENNPYNYASPQVNNKYFFQVPFSLEQSGIIHYDKHLEITPSNSYGIITILEDLVDLCLHFKLDQELVAIFILQFLQFEQMTTNFIDFMGLAERLEFFQDFSGFIQSVGEYQLYRELRNTHIVARFSYQLNELILKYNLINTQIALCQYIPISLTEYEQMILINQEDCIPAEDTLLFQKWIDVIGYNILQPNKQNQGKRPEFYRKAEQGQSAERIQTFIDQRVNNLKQEVKPCVYNQLLIVPPTPVLSFEEGEEMKVFLEMNQTKEDNYELVTKSQSSQYLHYLFCQDFAKRKQRIGKDNQKDYEIPNTKLGYRKVKFLNEYYKNFQDDQVLIYLNIKDFAFNIDYEIVEEQLRRPKLAQFLKKREIWYQDPKTRCESQLKVTKGVFFGEHYYSYLTEHLSSLLSSHLIELLKEYFKYFSRNPRVNNHNEHILIDIQQIRMDDENLEIFVQHLITEIKEVIKSFGFELNLEKSGIQIVNKGKSLIWKLNPQFELSDCFTIFGIEFNKEISIKTLDNRYLKYYFKKNKAKTIIEKACKFSLMEQILEFRGLGCNDRQQELLRDQFKYLYSYDK